MQNAEKKSEDSVIAASKKNKDSSDSAGGSSSSAGESADSRNPYGVLGGHDSKQNEVVSAEGEKGGGQSPSSVKKSKLDPNLVEDIAAVPFEDLEEVTDPGQGN